MKIETKLAFNNMKKNKKRTLYTTISLTLCTALILTSILLISSIRNGVSENFDTEYNDYHFILKDLSVERFNKIKKKSYIDKIYIQKSEDTPLEKVDSSFTPENNITVYLKYDNIKNVCTYSNNIIGSLELSEAEAKYLHSFCQFNSKLLTVHGFIDVTPSINSITKLPECKMRVNYSPIITLMIIAVIIVFSALFIIILYNAFLITINERKKEYAILNSVGGTEGQVLKMIFIEAIFMGAIGIVLGGTLSTLLANVVLNNINDILNRAGYYFRLVFDIKYIILALIIIIINIYFSVLIPSVKASSTSVIQGIRNNKEIKNKKRKKLLEKILPIEGRVAVKNIRRNKSKYKLIIFLLIICITSFISISTYITYEKETANLVTEYDVDAEISLLEKYGKNLNEIIATDYKSILKNYEEKYNKKIECIEYRYRNIETLVEPANAIMFNNRIVITYIDGKKSIAMNMIALDKKTYRRYIEEIKANDGDIIIYNNVFNIYPAYFRNEGNYTYKYSQALNSKLNIKMEIVFPLLVGEETWDYTIVKSKLLDRKYVFTDKLIDGFQELKTNISGTAPTLFISMEMYNELKEETWDKDYRIDYNSDKTLKIWNNQDELRVKIRCDDIVEFKNYMEKFEEDKIFVQYYTLDNQEKLIYIEIIELILKIMMIAIITIGIVSTVNIMNASLIERKEDFNIMYRIGATKGNIKKILIYECIYMFVKALIISIILSIPIIYKIIKETENVLVLDKLLIPFGSIGMFIGVMFVISLAITIYSARMIKEE